MQSEHLECNSVALVLAMLNGGAWLPAVVCSLLASCGAVAHTAPQTHTDRLLQHSRVQPGYVITGFLTAAVEPLEKGGLPGGTCFQRRPGMLMQTGTGIQ